ncbi:Fatty acyl-CoA reductase 2 [Halotydeus destructor]|nr:Fatty acyl-CoA reductase 2 [Halotydeus destructor]
MDNEDELEAMAVSKFYEGRPNSYTFTKALAEDYVHGNKGRLPVSIARLSIVISAISEPEPGFCDTPSAATLVLFLVGLGGLRTYRWKPEIRPNCIHADVCINSLIAIGWETATEHNSAKVFNVAASPEECYPQPFYFAGSTIVTRQFPSTTAFRYPASMLTPDGTLSYLYHKYVSELLFCILYDALMWICGKKSDIASKMRFLHKTRESLEPFHHTQWTFVRDNCDKLFAKLTDDERAIFKMEAGAVDFPRFCMDSWASLKKYKLKEDLTKVDQARSKMSLLRWVEILYHAFIWSAVTFISYNIAHLIF